MSEPIPLRLIALDADDLTIISAHLQDAVLKVGDIVWRPAEKRVALGLRRFDWEGHEAGEKRRRLAAIHFERVAAFRAQGVDPAAKDTILSLLAVTFQPSAEAEPAGEIMLTFSGGATLKLSVECIEAQLKDLGGMWETAHAPNHD
jgi:hypothetical protein